MLTLPVTVPVPDVLVIAPPLSVRLPLTVRANVAFAKVPPETPIVDAVIAPVAVRVPPETVSVMKVVESTDPVPVRMTVDVPAVNVPVRVHAPETVMIEALAVRVPSEPIFIAPAVIGKFEPEVVRVVPPDESVIDSVPAI